jgi:branched-chain amino acid transport system permease protein
MTIFWTTFDNHSIVPWIVVTAITVAAFWVMRRFLPEMVEAWNEANASSEVKG